MENTGLLMRDLSDEDKPREKILKHGIASLTDSELLAVLFRSGSRNESVMDLSRRVLKVCDNDIDNLARLDLPDITARFKGIGVAKAATLLAALELGRRRGAVSNVRKKVPVVRSSADAYELFRPSMMDLDHEEFWVLYLSHANRLIAKERMAIGGMDAMVTDIRILFRKALERKAHFVIIAHNHPSGLLAPSSPDKMMTRKIADAGKMIDIRLYDHLILGGNEYFSFADNGLIS